MPGEDEREAGQLLRVLFVENVAADAGLAERALRKDGLAFTSARVDTKDALLHGLREFRPDIVVADFVMPNFSGLEALALTLAHDPNLPFILLTGSIDEETAVLCMKAGATDSFFEERIARLPYVVKEAVATCSARRARDEAERALRETHANLTALITNTEDRIWAVDTSYRLIICNPAYLRCAADWARRTMGVGKSVLVDGLPQAVLDQWRGYYDRALRGESFGVELATHLEASRREMDYRFQPIRTADGGISGVVVSGRDITERKRAEDELSKSERQYRTLLNAIDEGFCIIQMIFDENEKPVDYRFLEINRSFERQTGLVDAQGKRMRELAPRHEEYWFEIYGKIAVTGQPARFVNRAEQLHRWYDVYAFRFGQPEDRQVAILFNDITERKQAEEALARERNLLRTLMDNLPDKVYVKDAETRYVLNNPAHLRSLGVTQQEDVLGKTSFDFFPQLLAAQYRADEQEVIRSGQPLVEREEIVVDLATDQPVWHLTTKVPFRDSQGKVVGLVGVSRDITERKQAEEALRESEGLLRGLFDNMTSGAAIYDVINDGSRGSDYIIKDFNATSLRIEGKRKDEVIGKSLLDLRPNIDQYGLIPVLQKVWRTGEPGHFPSTVYIDEKYRNWYENRVFRLPTAEIVAIYDDVTERKRTEEAERDQRQLAEALCETAAVLNRTLDLDQVLDTILENAGRVAPHDAGEVLLITPGMRVHDVRHRGYEERGLEEWAKGRDFPLSDFPVLGRVVETRQPVVVPDTRTFPGWVDVPEEHWIRSHLCAPIIGKDQVIGFICLSSVSPGTYGLEHARRLGAFADQAAVAMENAALFAQVRSGREQLRLLSRRLLESQELERRRVARELHDEVGQLLTGLKLVLQMTAAGAPAGQKPGLDEAETLVSELMARVRQLSLDLRPAMLDDLGLLPALLWHMPRYSQQTKVAVDFKHAGIEGRRFAAEMETAAYRIVQEALTNVARYSGAPQASVRVWSDAEALTVEVEDHGTGFDPEALLVNGKTSGLAGMRERVVLLNGELTLEASPGQGAHIIAVLPLAEPARKRSAK